MWYIKKSSMLGSGTVYYVGDNRWSSNFDDRKPYKGPTFCKLETYLWGKAESCDLHDKFNSVIRFEKVKGFSRIVS